MPPKSIINARDWHRVQDLGNFLRHMTNTEWRVIPGPVASASPAQAAPSPGLAVCKIPRSRFPVGRRERFFFLYTTLVCEAAVSLSHTTSLWPPSVVRAAASFFDLVAEHLLQELLRR
jgi:hypothetical protein